MYENIEPVARKKHSIMMHALIILPIFRINGA